MALSDRLLHALARGSTFDRVERVIPFAPPLAGVEASITVPGGVIWHPLAITATLTSDAVVANRVPQLVLDDGNTIVARIAGGQAQAASLAATYTWIVGGAFSGGTVALGAITVALPDLALSPGYRLRTITAGLDAGDTYTGLVLWVEELLELPRGVNEQVMAGREMLLDQTSAAARGLA